MHGPIDPLLFLMRKFKCFVTLHGVQNYLNADWMRQKPFFINFSTYPGQNYLKLISSCAAGVVIDLLNERKFCSLYNIACSLVTLLICITFFSEVVEFPLVMLLQLLKTRMISILNCTPPHAVTHTYNGKILSKRYRYIYRMRMQSENMRHARATKFYYTKLQTVL